YIRISSLATFNGEHLTGIEFAQKAAATAEQAGADMPRVWSLTFLGGAEAGLGQVTAGFDHLDQSYRGALAGGYDFQVGNAVYNSIWLAMHLGRGDLVEKWTERIATMPQVGFEPWPTYGAAFIALEHGQIVDAIQLSLAAVQKGREGGHRKMGWRAEVLLAHALAENLRAAEAANLMPPTSTRVDRQDVIYDAMPRVRCRLAAADLAGAEHEARLVPPEACDHGSPVDAVAEGTRDADWLREFMAKIPAKGEVLGSPRIAAARGRLALYEGRFDDAREALASAVAAFEGGKLQLAGGWCRSCSRTCADTRACRVRVRPRSLRTGSQPCSDGRPRRSSAATESSTSSPATPSWRRSTSRGRASTTRCRRCARRSPSSTRRPSPASRWVPQSRSDRRSSATWPRRRT